MRPLINTRSLKIRLLVPAVLWMALVLSVGGILLSAAFRQYVESNFDRRLEENLDAMIGASELAPEGYVRFMRPLADPRFVVPYSGWYWQVSAAGQEPFRSRSLWDQMLDVQLSRPAPSERISVMAGPEGQTLRMIERDIILPGSDTVFRYLVAGDIAEIRAESRGFARIVAWSLTGLGIGILAAMLLQVSFGLHPLRGIRHGLAAIRSGRARRLSPDVPPEIRPLVAEMNALIDHNEKLVARARTQAGNLAHALKTPLSVIVNETSANPSSQTARIIAKQADTMRRQVEHHLVRARAIAGRPVIGVKTSVREALDAIVRTLARLYAEKGVKFYVTCPKDAHFWGEREDFSEIFGNLLENAAKWAKSQVKVTVQKEQAAGEQLLKIDIEDDGPGVPAEQRKALFDRGRRLDENTPGSGLGLAIVRDIVEIYDGTIELGDSDTGGLKVSVCLPAAVY